MTATTHYDTLGLAPTASADQVRAAYRHLAKQLHPDTSRLPDAQPRFAAVAAAYEILSDRDKRVAYDAHLAAVRAGTAGPVDRRPHYTWTNIATGGAPAADEPSDLDDLYDTFFGGPVVDPSPPAAKSKRPKR